MSVDSLRLVATLAGSTLRLPGFLYPDAWPKTSVRTAQRAFQCWQWCVSAWRGEPVLVLSGAGVPAAKGRVNVTPLRPPWRWREPTAVFPGGSARRFFESLRLEATPEPELLLADSGVVVALGRHEGRPTVVHACVDASRLQRYADQTEAARLVFLQIGLADMVPRIAGLQRHGEHGCLYQERLHGRVVGVSGISAELLRTRVHAALAPLQALHGAGRHVAGGVDAAYIDMLRSDLGSVPEWAQLLMEPLAVLPDLSVRHKAPAVFAHGDYWLANLLFEPDREAVCGIIDWERARPHALAGLDALHLVIHTFAAWRGCSPLQVPVMMWLDASEPVLEQLLDAAQAAVGLDRAQMKEVALVLWLSHLHHHRHDRPHWRPERLDDWLTQPALAAARWLPLRKYAGF